jgi:hypothetical protein
MRERQPISTVFRKSNSGDDVLTMDSTSTRHSNRAPHLLRVGLLGLGLDAYWSQFTGLCERLEGYTEQVQTRISGPDRVIVNFGLLDSAARSVDLALPHPSSLRQYFLLRSYESIVDWRFNI